LQAATAWEDRGSATPAHRGTQLEAYVLDWGVKAETW